jgi:hypothetical protein
MRAVKGGSSAGRAARLSSVAWIWVSMSWKRTDSLAGK